MIFTAWPLTPCITSREHTATSQVPTAIGTVGDSVLATATRLPSWQYVSDYAANRGTTKTVAPLPFFAF